jgi:lipoate-protein ligase A
LLGSAQVRKRGVVLQHGTLPLVGDIARICDVVVFESEAARDHARARVRQRAATVAEALGHTVLWDEAAAALARGFAEALNLDLVEAPLTPREQALAERLRAEKYASPAWNRRI